MRPKAIWLAQHGGPSGWLDLGWTVHAQCTQNTVMSYSGRTKYSARTKAISATKSLKKTKFLKNYSYKDIKGSIYQQIIEQKNPFSALKVVMFQKSCFYLCKNFAGTDSFSGF
jgi:hypothetical protein